MTRRLVIALCMTSALIAVGYGVQRYVIAIDEGMTTDASPSVDVPVMSVTDAAPIDATSAIRAQVVASDGRVERKAADGSWQPIQAGDLLQADYVIRSARGGSVTITLSDNEIRMDPETTITVSAISGAQSQVRLGIGRIEADVPRNSAGSLGVSVDGSDLYADTDDGQFAVATTGGGDATVAARVGRVRVQARGKSVQVTAGQQTLVHPERPPSAPSDIPASLFLEIHNHKQLQNKKRFAIRGRTAPGAMVTVQGVRIIADERGAYSSSVALREGDNRIRIRSIDALGREQVTETHVERDSTGPDVSGDVTWGQP